MVLGALTVLRLLVEEVEVHAWRVVPLLAVMVCLLLEERVGLRNRSVFDRGSRAWMEVGWEGESKLIIAVQHLGRT